jgi:hypothetical protein
MRPDRMHSFRPVPSTITSYSSSCERGWGRERSKLQCERERGRGREGERKRDRERKTKTTLFLTNHHTVFFSFKNRKREEEREVCVYDVI